MAEAQSVDAFLRRYQEKPANRASLLSSLADYLFFGESDMADFSAWVSRKDDLGNIIMSSLATSEPKLVSAAIHLIASLLQRQHAQSAVRHREVGRKMPWLNQEVILAPHYASIEAANSGPLRRGDVGVVDQAAPLGDSVRVTFEGVQHNYPRKALLLKDASHFQGCSAMIIEHGTPMALLIIETLSRVIALPSDNECLNHICACITHWSFDNSLIERILFKSIAKELFTKLSLESLDVATFANVIAAILAIEASQPPLKALGMFCTGKNAINFERPAESTPGFYVFNTRAKDTSRFVVYTASAAAGGAGGSGWTVRKGNDAPQGAWQPFYSFYAFTREIPGVTTAVSLIYNEEGKLTSWNLGAPLRSSFVFHALIKPPESLDQYALKQESLITLDGAFFENILARIASFSAQRQAELGPYTTWRVCQVFATALRSVIPANRNNDWVPFVNKMTHTLQQLIGIINSLPVLNQNDPATLPDRCINAAGCVANKETAVVAHLNLNASFRYYCGRPTETCSSCAQRCGPKDKCQCTECETLSRNPNALAEESYKELLTCMQLLLSADPELPKLQPCQDLMFTWIELLGRFGTNKNFGTMARGLLLPVIKSNADSMTNLVFDCLLKILLATVSFVPDRDAKIGYVNESSAAVGDRVTRGPYWTHANQDGERGNTGTIVSIAGKQATVKWAHGAQHPYDIGADHSNLTELVFFTPPASGTFHAVHKTVNILREALGENVTTNSPQIVAFITKLAVKFIQETFASQIDKADLLVLFASIETCMMTFSRVVLWMSPIVVPKPGTAPKIEAEIVEAMTNAFLDVYQSHPRVLAALASDETSSPSTSLIKRLETKLRSSSSSSSSSANEGVDESEEIYRHTFQHALFATFVGGDCAFRSAVRKSARAFFETHVSNVCIRWLESLSVVDMKQDLVSYLNAFERMIRPFMLFKPSAVHGDAKLMAVSGISELLRLQPMMHPITKKQINLSKAACDMLATVVQTLNGTIQRYLAANGPLSMTSFLEACPSPRLKLNIQRRIRENKDGVKQFRDCVSNLNASLPALTIRNIGLILEETAYDVLREAVIISRNFAVTESDLSSILFDEQALSKFIGMGDGVEVFLEKIDEVVSKHSVCDEIARYTRERLREFKPFGSELSAKLVDDGLILVNLLGDPSTSINPIGDAVLKPLQSLIQLLPKLYIRSLFGKGFEETLAQLFREDVLELQDVNHPDYFSMLRKVVIEYLSLFRMLCIPRHCVSQCLKSLFGSTTDPAAARVSAAVQSVCKSFNPKDELLAETKARAAQLGLFYRDVGIWMQILEVSLDLKTVIQDGIQQQLEIELRSLRTTDQQFSYGLVNELLTTLRKYHKFALEGAAGLFLTSPTTLTSQAPSAVFVIVEPKGFCIRGSTELHGDVLGTLPKDSVVSVTEERVVADKRFLKVHSGWIGPVADDSVKLQSGVISTKKEESGEAVEADKNASGGWNCSVCTFLNQDDDSEDCEMCSAKRTIATKNKLKPRGACNLQSCPMKSIEACKNFMAQTGSITTSCGFCGCEHSEHAIIPGVVDEPIAVEHHYFAEHVFATDVPIDFLQELSSCVFEKLEHFINHVISEVYLIEHIVAYVNALTDICSQHLVRDSKELLERLGEIGTLVRFVTDLSHLSSRLKQSMAQRLIRDRCVNVDTADGVAELELVVGAGLKSLLGFTFAHDVRTMVTDYQFSKLISVGLEASSGHSKFGCLLMTGTVWPTECGRIGTWKPPKELAEMMQHATDVIRSGKFLELPPFVPALSAVSTANVEIVVAASKPPADAAGGISILQPSVTFRAQIDRECTLSTVLSWLQGTLRVKIAKGTAKVNGTVVGDEAAVILKGTSVARLEVVVDDGVDPTIALPAAPIVFSKVTIPRFCPSFLSQQQHVRLHWNPNYGYAVMGVSGRNYDFVVSTFQMRVLLSFNNAKTLTFGALLEETGIEQASLRDELLSLTAQSQNVLLTNSSSIHSGMFSLSDTFEVNEHFDNGNVTSVRIRTSRLSETSEAAYKRTLRQAANDAAVVDAAIVRLVKANAAKKDLVSCECCECHQKLSLGNFSHNQLLKPAGSSKCKACIAKSLSKPSPPVVDAEGVLPNALFDNVAHNVRQRLCLTRKIFEERLRRLIDEGCIEMIKGRIVYGVKEEQQRILSRMASQQVEQQQLQTQLSVSSNPGTTTTSRTTARQVSRQLSRTASVAPDEDVDDDDVAMQGLERTISAAESSNDKAFLQLSSDLDFLPDRLGKPVFVQRDLVLLDAKEVLKDISKRLNISYPRALSLLSDPRVRWNHRLAYDVFFDEVLPKYEEERSKRHIRQHNDATECLLRKDIFCFIEPGEAGSDLISLPCGHSFHRACIRDRLAAGSLGFKVDGAGDARAVRAVVDAVCPAMNEGGDKSICSYPIPWDLLFDLKVFGEQNEAAIQIWEEEVIGKRILESSFLYSCRGRGCDKIAVVTEPPSNATNAVQCTSCSTSFCFRCPGHWFEDHRPATCAHMLAWGASVLGSDPKSGKKEEDEDLLSRMEIFRNSVGCPRLCCSSSCFDQQCCGQRIQKTQGCQHLTCGGSSYRAQDWRGKGCGLDFCEVCESPLEESKCESSTCKRQDKAKKLKEEREQLKVAYGSFQEVYLPVAVRAKLLAGIDQVWKRYGEDGRILRLAVERLLHAKCALAHAIVFMKLEADKGMTETEKSGLDSWCESLKQCTNRVQALVLPYIRSPDLGLVNQGKVICHTEVLTLGNRSAGCVLCGDRAAPKTFKAPSSYELCPKCFLENAELPKSVALTKEYMQLDGCLQGFFSAFELALCK